MCASGLDHLLDLDGQTLVLEDGEHFVKFEARRVDVSKNRPHGIRYSLTLHDKDGVRLLGFDNAHAPPKPKKGYHGKWYEFDHKHRHQKDKGVVYVFENAAQLVDDFWKDVYGFLEI